MDVHYQRRCKNICISLILPLRNRCGPETPQKRRASKCNAGKDTKSVEKTSKGKNVAKRVKKEPVDSDSDFVLLD
jgi:hypothetical protein